MRNWVNSKKEAFNQLKRRIDAMKQNVGLFLGASTHILTSQVLNSTQEVQKAVISVRKWESLSLL